MWVRVRASGKSGARITSQSGTGGDDVGGKKSGEAS